MTDRVNSFLVVLDKDRRVDDIDAITTALRMVSGVVSVTPMVDDYTDVVARSQLRRELKSRLYDAIDAAFETDKGSTRA
jgi:hypothetical protein